MGFVAGIIIGVVIGIFITIDVSIILTKIPKKKMPETHMVQKEILYTDNTCVCCGSIIPEGRMVCPVCEMEVDEHG